MHFIIEICIKFFRYQAFHFNNQHYDKQSQKCRKHQYGYLPSFKFTILLLSASFIAIYFSYPLLLTITQYASSVIISSGIPLFHQDEEGLVSQQFQTFRNGISRAKENIGEGSDLLWGDFQIFAAPELVFLFQEWDKYYSSSYLYRLLQIW